MKSARRKHQTGRSIGLIKHALLMLELPC